MTVLGGWNLYGFSCHRPTPGTMSLWSLMDKDRQPWYMWRACCRCGQWVEGLSIGNVCQRVVGIKICDSWVVRLYIVGIVKCKDDHQCRKLTPQHILLTCCIGVHILTKISWSELLDCLYLLKFQVPSMVRFYNTAKYLYL